MKWEVCIKHFLCLLKYKSCLLCKRIRRVFCKHFFKNEWSETVTIRKAMICVTNLNSWAFKQKLEFWKTCIRYHELACFPILKDFSDDIHGSINEYDFLWFFNDSLKSCIMKWVSIRKFGIAWWTSKWPMYDGIKSCQDRRFIQKAQQNIVF